MIKLISSSSQGKRVCAAAARLSTKSGKACDIFDASGTDERNDALIKKVMSSGHRSLLEHQSFSFALDGVSVFVEQCLIEFRLSSFTVKSRRYVDFKNAGYYTPKNLSDEAEALYKSSMDARFDDYAKLVELGVPKEDARFVLPYCFYSSLYLSCNARELMHIIKTFTMGRLSAYSEIRDVGNKLADAFNGAYPGLLDDNGAILPCEVNEPDAHISDESPCKLSVSLIGEPNDAEKLLKAASRVSGRFCDGDWKRLAGDDRPRELECLNYTFLIKDISQSCATHFARHRIQSPIFQSPNSAISKNHFIVPETVTRDEHAREVYFRAFEQNTLCARKLVEMGLSGCDLVYTSLSGNTIDALITMNARELRLFMNLRTCSRAQWEIRQAAKIMLSELEQSFPVLFKHYGPSCATLGYCPEGRLSCGRVKRVEP